MRGPQMMRVRRSRELRAQASGSTASRSAGAKVPQSGARGIAEHLSTKGFLRERKNLASSGNAVVEEVGRLTRGTRPRSRIATTRRCRR
jgi:hypothetical protein